jgi:hypothetical protein
MEQNSGVSSVNYAFI